MPREKNPVRSTVSVKHFFRARGIDASRAAVYAVCVAASVCAACGTLQPRRQGAAEFGAVATYSDFTRATQRVAENLGGEYVQRPFSTPQSAAISDISRQSLSGVFIGYTAGMGGLVMDSVSYTAITEDSLAVTVRSYFPLITAAAISQQLALQNGGAAAGDALQPMSAKSKLVFQGLTLITPALGNTYLFEGNPCIIDLDVTPSVVIPLLVDAGFTYFLFREMDSPSKPGTFIFGTAALSYRVAGILGLSAEIDRYNTLARSGYDLSLGAVDDFRAAVRMDVPLP